MKELKVLYVEDDQDNREDLVSLLNGEEIGDFCINIKGEESFEEAIHVIGEYHLLILDLYKGVAGKSGTLAGQELLQKIFSKLFIPVIFYSGNTSSVEEFKSQLIGVVTKGDSGVDGLKNEISRLTKNNLPYLRENIHNHIDKELIRYLWDVIQKQNDKFTPENDDFSLGYLLLRNIGNSLSKKNVAKIIEDPNIDIGKVHPMEFYIYPVPKGEFENGEIVKNKLTNEVYVILTPSCDLVERFKGETSLGRKAVKILLAKSRLLSDLREYKDYESKHSNSAKNQLSNYIKAKEDRYFFLPETPFIENRIVDFQDKIMVDYSTLSTAYERIAKLDSPFAQSMTASFVRYYNRIGFPDLDLDYIFKKI